MSSPHPLDDDIVYTRTAKGQREAMVDTGRADAVRQRVLRMINGCTPVRRLLDLLGDADQMRAAKVLLELIDGGLVARVTGATRELKPRGVASVRGKRAMAVR